MLRPTTLDLGCLLPAGGARHPVPGVRGSCHLSATCQPHAHSSPTPIRSYRLATDASPVHTKFSHYTALVPRLRGCLPANQAKQTEEATTPLLLLPGSRHWGLRGLWRAPWCRGGPGLGRGRGRDRDRGTTATTTATTATASADQRLPTHAKDVGLQVCLCLLSSCGTLGGIRLRAAGSSFIHTVRNRTLQGRIKACGNSIAAAYGCQQQSTGGGDAAAPNQGAANNEQSSCGPPS